jgi:hypothetical protein
MSIPCAAMVHPLKGADLVDLDRRHATRRQCCVEATSRSAESTDGMSWGGIVKDVAVGGLKLGLCFPFRPGTYLAVDVQPRNSAEAHTVVCRVVHVQDRKDGTWDLGCEFLKPLTPQDVDQMT